MGMKATIFNEMMEQALLQLHTGFFARVVGVNGNLATVQPLTMVKAVGGQPQKQAAIPNCPVLDSAVKFTSLSPAVARRVQGGDTVYCVCADRDVTETRTGTFAAPVPGHHTLAGAVVVGII